MLSNSFRRAPRFRPQLESLSDRCLPSATFAGNLFAALSADISREYADSVRGDAVAVAQDQTRVAADLAAVQSALRAAVTQLGGTVGRPLPSAIQSGSVENIKALSVASKTVARAVLELETGLAFIRVAIATSATNPGAAALAFRSGIDQLTRGVSDFVFDPNIATAQTVLSGLDESGAFGL